MKKKTKQQISKAFQAIKSAGAKAYKYVEENREAYIKQQEKPLFRL